MIIRQRGRVGCDGETVSGMSTCNISNFSNFRFITQEIVSVLWGGDRFITQDVVCVMWGGDRFTTQDVVSVLWGDRFITQDVVSVLWGGRLIEQNVVNTMLDIVNVMWGIGYAFCKVFTKYKIFSLEGNSYTS